MVQQFPKEIADYFVVRPPDTLYHYTGQAGLLGIMQSGGFWATKIQYMNDATEFRRALSLARDELNNLISALQAGDPGTTIRIIYNQLLRTLDGLEEVHLFAVCFCEEGDLLGQWRGYTGGRQGYSIGFSAAALSTAAAKSNFLLGRCIYDAEDQKAIVRAAIEFCVIEIKADRAIWGGHGPLARILFECGAFFKDPSFREEKEWRLISGQVFFRDDNLCFRQGDSMITPYYKLDIQTEGVLPIQHVFIGPCPNTDLSRSSVTALLMRNGLTGPLRGVQMAFNSQIPFRNW